MWRRLLPIQGRCEEPQHLAYGPTSQQKPKVTRFTPYSFWPLTSPHLEVSPRLSQSHRTAELKRPQEYLV